LIDRITAQGGVPVIPPRRCTARRGYDRHLYKERHLIECFINKIKHFRRIATRYEKTARAFLSMLFLCATVILMR
jgi:transposase